MGQPDLNVPALLSDPTLTRRHFIAALGATALAAKPAIAAQRFLARAASYPMPTYFSADHLLPQTRSAGQLAAWMESEHLGYSLDGWFFFGRLIDEGDPHDVGSFFVALQRLPFRFGSITFPNVYGAAVGFDQRSRNSYEYAIDAFRREDRPGGVVVRSNPWSVNLYSGPPRQAAPLITMRALSGRMGEVGTVYLLSADIPKGYSGQTPSGRLQASVRVRDRFGVINQGYGTTAFSPQFLTKAQKTTILRRDGGSVQRYLGRTGDPMTCQGTWYYQLPFLDVEHFSVTIGGVMRSTGRTGLLWMDYTVQGYNRLTYDVVLKKSTYEFFAMQFPDQQAALMVLHVDGANGRFPVATLYDRRSQRTANGAREPRYSWPITGIEIRPDSGSRWHSRRSGNDYYLRYHIRLRAARMSADLTIRMAIADQEVQERKGVYDYEGIGDVEGTLNGRRIKGQAFLEAVPAVA